MKKVLFALCFVIVMSLLISCGGGDKTPCEHKDLDGNGLCDVCGVKYTDGTNGDDPGNDGPVTVTHTHKYDKKSYKYLVSGADCNNAPRYAYVCSCGDKGEETHSYGEPWGHKYKDGVCKRCGDVSEEYEVFTRVNKNGKPNENGDYILFGEYPMTIKADDVKITDVTDENGYFLGSDGEYYAMVTGSPSNFDFRFSSGEKIIYGVEYYFKVEPIRWRILSTDGANLLIMCDSIINHKAFQPNYKEDTETGICYTTANGAPEGTLANEYKYSRIRQWLNEEFYTTVFTELEKELIVLTTIYNNDGTDSFEDKIYIPSRDEVTNPDYGFFNGTISDEMRALAVTDFSIASGGHRNIESPEHYGNASWYLRTPFGDKGKSADKIIMDGWIMSSVIDDSTFGIVPMLKIKINEHTPDGGERIDEILPTCTERGSYTLVVRCTECGEELLREERTSKSTGHTKIEDPEVSATCTEPGIKAGAHCAVCNVEIKESLLGDEKTEIPPLGHDYRDGECTRCGKKLIYSEGLEYEDKGNGTCYVVGMGNCTDTDVIIPETSLDGLTVVGIGKGAFMNKTGIRTVEMPNTVTAIDEGAFSGCTSLENILFSKNLVVMGSEVLCGCSSLETISIPSGVTQIARWLLKDCAKLESISLHNKITSVAEEAFLNCTSLEKVYIGAGLKELGTNAFGNCSSLKYITIHALNLTYMSLDNNIYTKNGKTLVLYAIGNTNTEFTIPPLVTKIGAYAFFGAPYLENIEIPEGVTKIGDQAFRSSMLKKIILPGSMVSIGKYSFADCPNLKLVYIFENLTTIGIGAFQNDISLESFSVDSKNTAFSSTGRNLYSKDGKTLIQYAIGKKNDSFVIPDSVETVEEMAFYGCTNLVSVTVGRGVTKIGSDAFYGCSSLTDVYYEGTEEEWNNVEVLSNNECLNNAEKHYNCSASETKLKATNQI